MHINSPPTMKKALTVLIPLFFFCGTARAQLQWEKRTLKFYPAPSETEVAAHFKFKNAGSYAVSIVNLKSSCGCTRASATKRTYAPGESGEITAVFNAKSRYGLQEKNIAVTTDDPRNPETVLVMQVAIMEILQIKPSFVFWKIGEAPAPKTISLKVQNDLPVKAVTVVSDNPGIVARVETVIPEKEFRIVVTPKQTQAATGATLAIQTDFPPDAPKTYVAQVRIK